MRAADKERWKVQVKLFCVASIQYCRCVSEQVARECSVEGADSGEQQRSHVVVGLKPGTDV